MMQTKQKRISTSFHDVRSNFLLLIDYRNTDKGIETPGICQDIRRIPNSRGTKAEEEW